MRKRDERRWKSHLRARRDELVEPARVAKTGGEKYDGFKLTRDAVMEVADRRRGFRVCGMRKETTTPELCRQALLDYAINRQAVYGGWHKEAYRVSGRI